MINAGLQWRMSGGTGYGGLKGVRRPFGRALEQAGPSPYALIPPAAGVGGHRRTARGIADPVPGGCPFRTKLALSRFAPGKTVGGRTPYRG